MPETAAQPDPAPAKAMKPETKAVIAFVIVGIIVGMASWGIGQVITGNQGNFAALGLAIVVLVGLPQLLKKMLGIEQKFKWWLTNGGWIYLFVWFIIWIMCYNLL
jgi:hypothetical protein